MQAMAETLMTLRQQVEIMMPEFRFYQDTRVYYGRMKGQSLTAEGTTFDLYLWLYVDVIDPSYSR
jgi:hypothetical protein